MSDTLEVRIWRGGADGGLVHYNVPRQASQTVLDVVTWVQRNDDPSLAYRFACRVGMCGSCAMTVNGRPRWTCRTHVDKVTDGDSLTIEPLRNVPVVKDLAADMTPFFEKWQSARGRFDGASTRRDAYARIKPDSPERQTANAHVECINCAVCHSACDVVSWRKEYLGPAALNRAWVAFNDERDAHPGDVLQSVAVNGGCMSCHTHQSCTQHCPVGLDPSAAIAGLKKALLRAYLSGRLKQS